jgi:hypothetical protein
VQCSVFYDESKILSLLQYPQDFLTAITKFLHYGNIDELSSSFIQFIESCRNNTLQSFILSFGLSQLSEVLSDVDHPLSQSPKDYLQLLSMLFYFEEMSNKLDIYRYDIHFRSIHFSFVNVRSADDYLSPFYLVQCRMKIKGSGELRPKILPGNRIRIRPVPVDCEQSQVPYVELIGVVFNYILASEEAVVVFSLPKVLAPFVSTLSGWNTLRYHIRFVEDRSPFGFIQYLLKIILPMNPYLLSCFFPTHTEVDKLKELKQFHIKSSSILPSSISPSSTPQAELPSSSQWTSSSSSGTPFNKQQEEAMAEMLLWCSIDRSTVVNSKRGTTHSVNDPLSFYPMPPFILFGPAGTGKTSSLIETILRILRKFPEKRILACAPSEAAADVLAIRLAGTLSPSQLHRFNWWQRLLASVPANLLPYCHQSGSLFEIHPLVISSSFQVIVSTCQASGTFFSDFSNLKFDVVIVDEASQATEPEVMIPLSLVKVGGIMVIAGDIHQLAASTKFPLYRDCVPFLSMQERLLKMPFYSHCLPENVGVSLASLTSDSLSFIDVSKLKKKASSSFSSPSHLILGTFLNQNYRTHSSILSVSSKLFYNNKLVACGNPEQLNKFWNWSYLLKALPPSPLMFINVNGIHEHEMDSPSFYNMEEVNKVVEVCQSIVREKIIPMNEIGVIAAFRKQVLKIRTALRTVDLANVNVGSVDDFQGQEVAAIIVSTVLTSPITRFSNSKGTVGLLNDPKRFNVSITRGMALCCVLGSKDFLSLDPFWKQYLNECSFVENQGLKFEGISPFKQVEVGTNEISAKKKQESKEEDTAKLFDKTVEEVIQHIFK